MYTKNMSDAEGNYVLIMEQFQNQVHENKDSSAGIIFDGLRVKSNGPFQTDGAILLHSRGGIKAKLESLTLAEFYCDINDELHMDYLAIHMYMEEMLGCCVTPEMHFNVLFDVGDKWAEKLTRNFIDCFNLLEYAKSYSNYYEGAEVKYTKQAAKSLANSVVHAAAVCVIHDCLFGFNAPGPGRKTRDVLLAGGIPLAWKGNFFSGEVVAFNVSRIRK